MSSDASAVRDRLRILAGSQGGVFTVADAERVGISRRRGRTLLAAGHWMRIRRGVYAEAAIVRLVARDPRAEHCLRTSAALLGLRGFATAAKVSAACLFQLDLMVDPPPRPVVVRAPECSRGGHATGSLRVLRARLPSADLTRVAGVPTTGLARTVVDTARSRDLMASVVLVDSALRFYGADLLDEMHRVARRCRVWPGIGRALEALMICDARSESALESIARVVMHREQVPRPETQVWIGDLEPEFRADFGWPAHRTLGEADGRVKYTSSDVLWMQAKREERMHDLGFEVVRFDRAATRRTGELAARLHRGFARARPGRGRIWPDPPWWSPGLPWQPPGTCAGDRDGAWWLWDPADLGWADEDSTGIAAVG